MNFVFREYRASLEDSLKTAVTFSGERILELYLENRYSCVTMRPFDKPDERTGWTNEGSVLVNGKCVGMYGEIPDVIEWKRIVEQQRIIAYLAGKLADIANITGNKTVKFTDIIELAERNISKTNEIRRLLAAGIPLEAIADQWNCTVDVVTAYLHSEYSTNNGNHPRSKA